jgi:hypothetical protein
LNFRNKRARAAASDNDVRDRDCNHPRCASASSEIKNLAAICRNLQGNEGRVNFCLKTDVSSKAALSAFKEPEPNSTCGGYCVYR